MVKYANKPTQKKSKRVSTKMNVKIHRKSMQQNKRKKKQAKQLRALGLVQKRHKKDLPIPNLYPFKAKIIESVRRRNHTETADHLASHKIDPVSQSEKQEREMIVETELDQGVQIRGTKKYFKEVRKVLENADIILEVIDARDPMASRNKEIEAEVLGMPGEKRLILVMNKIDLVPLDNARNWQNYLRRQFPCVLFKANLQKQQSHLSSNALYKKSLSQRTELAEQLTSSSKAVGPDHLIQIIKQVSRKDGVSRAVTVGVIGYPNVGKSSVINSLKRTKACGVSPLPGYTKNIQEVKLDGQVKMIDCPGVVFAKDSGHNLVLQNTLTAKGQDLLIPVQLIVERVDRDELLKLYEIADFRDTNEFLGNVARCRGQLKPGGIPDILRSAKLVVQDWNRGKIPYYSRIPILMQ